MDLVVICTQATGERDKKKKKTIEWNGREKKKEAHHRRRRAPWNANVSVWCVCVATFYASYMCTYNHLIACIC